jgi:hypothetical protein
MSIGNYNSPNSNIPRPVMGIGDIRKGGPIGRVKTSPQTRSFATDGAVPIVGGILMRAWERAFARRFEIPQVVEASANAVASGAFFTLITIVSGGADNGDIYLQGGTASGGTGNIAVANYLLFDASGPTWAGTAGDHLMLTINGTGSEVDDVLMPTFDVTSASIAVAAPASNTLPTVGSLSGVVKVSLGQFGTDVFYPANVGNVQVSFCFGGFTVTRA